MPYNKIGIICAVKEEVAPFFAALESDKVTRKAMLEIHEGRLCGIDAAVVACGVCKVNAALTTQLLIDTFGVDAVINSGTCGGADASVGLGDTVVAAETAYHDVADFVLTDYHPHMDKPVFKSDSTLLRAAETAALNSSKIRFGKMATGEVFVTDDNRADIIARHSPLTVDMETAAMAHVCYVNAVPFISVRTVTDMASAGGMDDFLSNVKSASQKSMDFVAALLGELG